MNVLTTADKVGLSYSINTLIIPMNFYIQKKRHEISIYCYILHIIYYTHAGSLNIKILLASKKEKI
jgi:hypothetical protein